MQTEGNSYHILDQYCQEGVIHTVSIDFVKNNATSVIIFYPIKCKDNNIKQYILENLEEWDIYGFSQYEAFIEDMKNNLDIEKEIGEDPVSSTLIMYLKNLFEDRQNFIEAVSLFEEEFLVNMYMS